MFLSSKYPNGNKKLESVGAQSKSSLDPNRPAQGATAKDKKYYSTTLQYIWEVTGIMVIWAQVYYIKITGQIQG